MFRGTCCCVCPQVEVVRKVATSFFCLLVFLSVCKVFPVERNIDDDFIANTPLYAQVVYLYLSMLTTRPKYYFVWTLGGTEPSFFPIPESVTDLCCNLLFARLTADAINNAAGFGFNGYDGDGAPRWDLISNLRILNIEVRPVFSVCVLSDPVCSLILSICSQFATSFKVFLDNWNIQTAHWLKRSVHGLAPMTCCV